MGKLKVEVFVGGKCKHPEPNPIIISIRNHKVDFEYKTFSSFLYYTDFDEIKITIEDKDKEMLQERERILRILEHTLKTRWVEMYNEIKERIDFGSDE